MELSEQQIIEMIKNCCCATRQARNDPRYDTFTLWRKDLPTLAKRILREIENEKK